MSFEISAFGDEIDPDLDAQLAILAELGVDRLELRAAWGTNVLRLADEDARRARRLCDERGIAVSCIGSPIGKTPIVDPIEREEENLRRILALADILGTRRVRVFSFYPPRDADVDAYLSQATDRLGRLVALAERAGAELLLENERDIVGDTPERCRALLSGVNSPFFRFCWDPGNFVVVGVDRPTERAWPLLGERVAHVHVKDVGADGAVTVAGAGAGQIPELLTRLRAAGYRGGLALEPHLAHAGARAGFSGPDGMRHAASALRQLLA